MTTILPTLDREIRELRLGLASKRRQAKRAVARKGEPDMHADRLVEYYALRLEAMTVARHKANCLIIAAERLAARGFFAESSCADDDTAADMAFMRDALAEVSA